MEIYVGTCTLYIVCNLYVQYLLYVLYHYVGTYYNIPALLAMTCLKLVYVKLFV